FPIRSSTILGRWQLHSFLTHLETLLKRVNDRAGNTFVSPSPPSLVPINLYGNTAISAMIVDDFPLRPAKLNNGSNW
ncbi:hypothetical protein, partial [Pseudomonas asuensis]|uniref:hypothetical protein n=1 Tax=Pseudomonas asuensis TaxID=1825787 RepID=UPI001E39E667